MGEPLVLLLAFLSVLLGDSDATTRADRSHFPLVPVAMYSTSASPQNIIEESISIALWIEAEQTLTLSPDSCDARCRYAVAASEEVHSVNLP